MTTVGTQTCHCDLNLNQIPFFTAAVKQITGSLNKSSFPYGLSCWKLAKKLKLYFDECCLACLKKVGEPPE